MKNKKKRGGNSDFIEFLIKDKAESLAFYFKINNISINQTKLDNYIEQIGIGYSNCKKNKLNFTITHDKIDLFATQLVKINSELYGYNTINRYNFGTEGHIIKELIKDKNLSDDEYIDNLSKYISKFAISNPSEIKDAEKKIYDLNIYFQKIGSDIALYEYIFENKYTNSTIVEKGDYIIKEFNNKFFYLDEEDKKKFEDIIKKIFDNDITILIKKNFRLSFNKFLKSFNNDIFIRDFCNEIITKSRSIKIDFEFSKEDYKFLQQCFNIYNYKLDIRKKNYIYYCNSRIINCDLSTLNNGDSSLNNDIFNLIKNLRTCIS